MPGTDEEPLGGGYVNDVVRVGDTVRRAQTKPRPFAREILRFLEDRSWPASPRYLGVDDKGRDTLTFIDGYVPWRGDVDPVEVWGTRSVARVAQLARELHDLTAGSALAGDEEVVCHNDLSPRNTVYHPNDAGELVPVAFIDWDLAAPGRRIHDVALLCWQWACHSSSEPDDAAALVGAAVDAYGCDHRQRSALVETILWWQERCWRGIQAKVDEARPSVERLKEAGAVAAVQADLAWTARHRAILEAALLR